jgi:hypothetical protein
MDGPTDKRLVDTVLYIYRNYRNRSVIRERVCVARSESHAYVSSLPFYIDGHKIVIKPRYAGKAIICRRSDRPQERMRVETIFAETANWHIRENGSKTRREKEKFCWQIRSIQKVNCVLYFARLACESSGRGEQLWISCRSFYCVRINSRKCKSWILLSRLLCRGHTQDWLPSVGRVKSADWKQQQQQQKIEDHERW